MEVGYVFIGERVHENCRMYDKWRLFGSVVPYSFKNFKGIKWVNGLNSHLLEDKVELVCVLKEFNELDYVRVSLAVVEGLHLTEHPGAGVPRHFVDDLHSELLARVDVHARLYRSIRALA